MSSKVRKYSESLTQKVGPMKATLPMSFLRGTSGTLHSNSGNCNLLPILSPQMRHISPEHSISGHRSSGGCFKGTSENVIRRTASLDTLYMRPTLNLGMVSTVLHLDKSTQTDESFFERSTKGSNDLLKVESSEIKIEKVIRPVLTRAAAKNRQRSQRTGEHSVSSQTLSPIHGKASPVLIPQRTNSQFYGRPMRSSIEGLNQEIEKIVLYTGQIHSGRNEFGLFSRGTPEGHRAPLAELFHNDMRSVNTQTPIGDMLSSDDSHSTSPEDVAPNASPRINRFLAREPPDGCEKVCSKPTEADQGTTRHFKPCVGFQLRPSLGSAFQSLQPIPSTSESDTALNDQNQENQEEQ